MNRRKIDIVMSAILIVASIIILTNDNLVEGGMETELGSMFVPRVVAFFIIMFAGTIGAQSVMKMLRSEKLAAVEKIDTRGFAGIAIYFAIFTLYWLLVSHLGFIITTALVMFSIAYLLGGRNWIAITAISVITPLLVYYGCSKYLRVFLPTWTLF